MSDLLMMLQIAKQLQLSMFNTCAAPCTDCSLFDLQRPVLWP